MDANDLELVEGSVKDYHPPTYDNWYRNIVVVVLCLIIALLITSVCVQIYQLNTLKDLVKQGVSLDNLVAVENDQVSKMMTLIQLNTNQIKLLEEMLLEIKSVSSLLLEQSPTHRDLLESSKLINLNVINFHKASLGMMLLTYDDLYRDKGYLTPINYCPYDPFFCVMSRGFGPGGNYFKTQFSRCFFSGTPNGDYIQQSVNVGGYSVYLGLHSTQDILLLPSGRYINMSNSRYEYILDNEFSFTCLFSTLS